MITLQLIALWLFIPFVILALSELHVRRVRSKVHHDRILYAFCAARDVVAIKAMRGELDENSETFRYFFKTLGGFIHEHKRHPIGFAHLAKGLAEEKNRPVPTWKRRLLRELKKSDSEIKQVVGRYIGAIELVMKQDSVVAFFEKIPFLWREARGELSRDISKNQFMSGSKRRFARFNSEVANVVNYNPAQFAIAA